MSVSVKAYDFSMAAGGSFQIHAVGTFFRILTSTGAVSVTGEFGEASPLLQGQGLKDSPFTRLQIKDISGYSNGGKILVASSEFVDQQMVLSGNVNSQRAVSTLCYSGAYSITSAWWAAINGPASGRRFIAFQNKDTSATVWVCPQPQSTTAPVNATDGFRLAPGEKLSFDGALSSMAWWIRTDIPNSNFFASYSD